MIFDTSAYVISHNREPRGEGSWAFGINSRNPDLSDGMLWAPYGTLTQAKAWAKNECFRRGIKVHVLYVMP